MPHKVWELATMGLGRCFKVTLQTRAPENFRVRRCGAERSVSRAQTRERGPPSAYAEIYLERSNQWLLIYSNFHILRSSSIRGCLHLKVVFIDTLSWLWFGPMSLCFKFEEDPIIGCWDIQFFIFWGHLPLDVVFHWKSSSLKPSFGVGLVPWAYV